MSSFLDRVEPWALRLGLWVPVACLVVVLLTYVLACFA